MKNRTPKRAKRDAEARPWREAQVRIVGQCEWCDGGYWGSVEVHEIACGKGIRDKAQDKPYATLVLCRPCHMVIQGWSRERQLALLYLRRPGDYDLDAFHRLIARCKPDQSEVDCEISNLLGAKE